MERHSFEHELAGPAVSPRRTSTRERDEWLGESSLPPLPGPACRRFAFAPKPTAEEESERPVPTLDAAGITDEVIGDQVLGKSAVSDDRDVDEDPWMSSDSSGFETADTDEDRAEITPRPTEAAAPLEAEELEGEPAEGRRKEVFSFVEEDHDEAEEHSPGDAAAALAEAGARDVLDGIADRLEGVADRLRSSSLDELLRSSGDDPLALLLTGFVLGASQRRSED